MLIYCYRLDTIITRDDTPQDFFYSLFIHTRRIFQARMYCTLLDNVYEFIFKVTALLFHLSRHTLPSEKHKSECTFEQKDGGVGLPGLIEIRVS